MNKTIDALASQLWGNLDEDERACVRFGMLPYDKSQGVINRLKLTPDEQRQLAVAVMECAKRDGGMVV